MMGVACSSRRVRVSQVLSSSSPWWEEVSSSEEDEDEEEDDNCDKSVEKAAVVLISEHVDETLELMLEGSSLSCEDASSTGIRAPSNPTRG